MNLLANQQMHEFKFELNFTFIGDSPFGDSPFGAISFPKLQKSPTTAVYHSVSTVRGFSKPSFFIFL